MNPDVSPTYIPTSPQMNPDGSPTYIPTSPQMNPDGSPTYIPTSPQMNPDESQSYSEDMQQMMQLASQSNTKSNSQFGGKPIFSSPNLNNIFNNLNETLQSQIIQLPLEKQEHILTQIMQKSLNNDPIKNAFNVLPLYNQVFALQQGYGSMAKEFTKISKEVQDPLITIKTPTSISEELSKKFPIISIDKKGGDTNANKKDEPDKTETTGDNSETKKITFS
jgi:hypothetical protein